MTEKTIEYFYSAHSAYAYLGAWELDRIATASGAFVVHRPYDFDPVFAATGRKRISQRSQEHIDYFFDREMVRWAEWRGLPMIRHRPTHHDNPLALANGAIIAAGIKADVLSRAILQVHWKDDADIADETVIADVADRLGLDGQAIVRSALSDKTQAQHLANTNEAIERSVFGSPTYFVDGDMFYGQDRLFMVERALAHPFAL